MNPIKKLSKNVKSLLSASNQVNNFLKAVQELVYNSIDANATSIAVRVHIEEGSIQVIDNGHGINKNYFKVLGHSHMTSKVTDISTLKSMPNTYGYRGQALANIVQVSQCVKITSRSNQSEDTFIKVFEYGKEKEILATKIRPSVGTTVEVKGILYNLCIQKKCTNNLTKLDEIKSFLQDNALIHYNISMSLRDDSTNEIVFKIHKNRDIYQTLSSLYDIQKSDVQELQVEKNEYKVVAYIGKNSNDDGHLVFLNGKMISSSSKIHKLLNGNFSKFLKLDKADRMKTKNIYNKYEEIKNNDIPFYLIFIKCPYNDYDLNTTLKHTIVNFKDWSQISKLIEKLVRFYIGDITVKETDENNKTMEVKAINKSSHTRNQVKQIIDRILGSKQKIIQVSQLHNGIKGKQAKRKANKKLRIEILSSKSKKSNFQQKQNKNSSHNVFPVLKKDAIKLTTPNFIGTHNTELDLVVSENKEITNLIQKKTTVTTNNKLKKHNKRTSPILKSKTNQRKICVKAAQKAKKKGIPVKTTSLLNKFIDPTDSVQQRYKTFAQMASDINNKRCIIEGNQRKEVISEETVEYENITENRITTVRGKINEIICQDIFPIPSKAKGHQSNKQKSSLLSTHDILNTVLNSQPNQVNTEMHHHNLNNNEGRIIEKQEIINNRLYKSGNCESPLITFQSHNYERKKIGYNYLSHDGNYVFSPTVRNCLNVFKKPKAFLSKKSIDNFTSINNRTNVFKRKLFKKNNWLKDTLKKTFNERHERHENICNREEQSSYTIQYSESDNYNFTGNKFKNNIFNPSLSYQNHFATNIEQSICAYTLSHTPQFIDFSNNQTRSNFLFESDEFIRTVNKRFDNIAQNSHTTKNVDGHHETCEDNLTYTINNNSCNEIEPSYYNTETCDKPVINATYTVGPKNSIINKDENIIDNYDNICIFDDDENIVSNNEINLTKSQNEDICDPIQICETVMDTHELLNDEFATSFNIRNDSLNMLVNNNDYSGNADNLNINNNDKIHDIDFAQISHHFLISQIPNCGYATVNEMEGVDKNNVDKNNEVDDMSDENFVELDNAFDFKIKERLCFLPKGMSQIFKSCNSKAVTENQNFIEDYYEDRIYNEFVNKVQNTVEIFEPRIQEARDLVTKDIDKVNNKLKKDTASLKFDGESLKDAKVLGQVDQKFIAAVIKGIDESKSVSEFLVLFDQHAVHERIRLETNLSDYLTEVQWNSVSLGEVTLKLTNDEIRYLHNFKEKFTQFGLQWNILNGNEIFLTAIPKAVLGKNARPVDKIITAVQSLMKEIINTIKLQSGCVSIYPKSIMELVFSEACRYAIKFGDHLSKTECSELLRNLSECKTPFQCAHGRPVMAVLMDIKPIDISNYKVCVDNIKKFKKVT